MSLVGGGQLQPQEKARRLWGKVSLFRLDRPFPDFGFCSSLSDCGVHGILLVQIAVGCKTPVWPRQLAKDCTFALTGGLYSRSPVNIERAKAELVCGNLYINRGITGAIVGRQPFGGFKMSGGGTKAGGREYLQHFLVPRVITENCLRRGFAPAEE